MDDYDAGYSAYWAGVGYDESETTEWQSGWLDAEMDDWSVDGDYEYP